MTEEEPTAWREYKQATVHIKGEDGSYEGPVKVHRTGWVEFPNESGELLNQSQVEGITPK